MYYMYEAQEFCNGITWIWNKSLQCKTNHMPLCWNLIFTKYNARYKEHRMRNKLCGTILNCTLSFLKFLILFGGQLKIFIDEMETHLQKHDRLATRKYNSFLFLVHNIQTAVEGLPNNCLVPNVRYTYHSVWHSKHRMLGIDNSQSWSLLCSSPFNFLSTAHHTRDLNLAQKVKHIEKFATVSMKANH
jgi:hypothetical protein